MANSKLRVLPLGGLGEIGKNMTVFEYEDRIVVVDVGLRFPTAEMVGIDLVLPDFAYLRERVDDIEGIVVTHGHEDHLGSLPWVLRELAVDIPVLRRPADHGDGALQARRAPAARRSSQGRQGRRKLELGPVRRRARAHDALDPRRGRRGLTTPVGTILVTGDYKFDQTPVDGIPADVGAAGRARPGGPAAAVRGLHQRRPSRLLAQRGGRGAQAAGGLPRAARGASS